MWSGSGLPSGHCEGTVSGICKSQGGYLTNEHHFHIMFFIFQGPGPNPETVHWNMAVCSGDIFKRRGKWNSCCRHDTRFFSMPAKYVNMF